MTSRPPYELLLQTWARLAVAGVLGAKVIWSHQSAPRPGVDYVTLHVGAMPTIGQASSRVKDEAYGGDYKGEVVSSYRGTLSVNTYGDTSWELMRDLIRSLNLSTVQEANRALGIAVAGNGSPIDFTTNVDTIFERRWQADFSFHWDDIHNFAAAAVETATAVQV